MIDTSVTLIAYNRADLTVQCIEALRQVTARPFHLTVVDNASDEPLRETLRRYKSDGVIDTLILHKRNMGVSVAANAGWASSEHPYYVRIDNDVIVRHPGWLDALVDRAAEGKFHVVAYKFCSWHETTPMTLPSGLAYEDTKAIGAGCALIPRNTHEILGFWNEDYLYGWEDLEYSNRVTLVGGTLADVNTEGVIDHLGPEADAKLPEYQNMKMARSRSTFGADSLFLLNTAMFELGLRPLYVIRKFLPSLGEDGITSHTINPEYKTIITRQNLFRTEFLKEHSDGDIRLNIPKQTT